MELIQGKGARSFSFIASCEGFSQVFIRTTISVRFYKA